ncbi:MAG: hypothetical protein HYV07_27160 [Deltaproteobacteria bacterium]|nr:hypothetical protein [Deltaproteobacteria bacterium]
MLTALLALLIIGVPVGFAVLGAGAVAWHMKRRRRIRSGAAVLRIAARSMGLTRTSPYLSKKLVFSGPLEGLPARVELDDGIVLRVRLALTRKPTLEVSSVFTKEGTASTNPLVATALVRGDLLAPMGKSGVRLEVSGARAPFVVLELAAPDLTEHDLVEVLAALARLSLRAMGDSAIEELLERNVEADRLPSVRRESLEALKESFPESASTARALQLASSSNEPGLRFLSADAATSSGQRALEDLAVSDETPADVREKAIVAISKSFAADKKRSALMLAFPKTSWWAQASILLELTRSAHAEPKALTVRDDMLEVLDGLAGEVKPEAVATLVESFGRLGDEDAIVAFLDHPELSSRMGALRALGAYGTPRSIPRIKERVGPLTSTRFKESASQAIDEIKQRHALPGAEPGLLTLSGDASKAGALAVSTDAGALQLLPEGKDPRT